MFTSITASLLEHHPYDSQHFVGRTSALQVIQKKIWEAQAGLLTESIANFWGVSGIGKSWLLAHLYHLYHYPAQPTADPHPPQPSFALQLHFEQQPTTLSWPALVQRLAADTLQQLAGASLDGETIQQLGHAATTGDGKNLIHALVRLARRHVPLLLLDNVDQLAAADWLMIEQQLIEPLARSGRVVVVLSGRRPVARWHRFEARRRVMDANKCRLDPFDVDQMIRQVVQSRLPLALTADTLLRYSAGIPALISALARAAAVWNDKPAALPRDGRWLEKQHGAALLQLLRLAEDQILHAVPPPLRSILNRVAPLRFYRLGSLRAMVENGSSLIQPQPDSHYLYLLRELEQTKVVWWDHAAHSYAHAYVICAAARHLINARLRLEDNGRTCRALNQCAITMYWQWATADPTACEEAIREIWFHAGILASSSRQSAGLRRQAHSALTFAGLHLPHARLLALRDQLLHDDELARLLPPPLYRDLLAQIDTVTTPDKIRFPSEAAIPIPAF